MRDADNKACAGQRVWIVDGVEQTAALGEALGKVARPGSVVILTGELGAGKTQLVKGMARGMGIEAPVTSPTFNLMLEHQSATGRRLRHFDLYRLEDAEELEDMGYFEALESDAVAAVEWGDRFPGHMPADWLELRVEYLRSGWAPQAADSEQAAEAPQVSDAADAADSGQAADAADAPDAAQVSDAGQPTARRITATPHGDSAKGLLRDWSDAIG
jgi:tRNA threonylcarbamoyladenosine biosynthesis protein TsaE